MPFLGRIIDKDLLSSFWANASERIDARIAAAKASAATPSTAGLVKPGSGLAVASDGTLSAKVDGSTIDFNASGQLTALGGGGGISYFVGYIGGVGAGTKFGNFTAYSQETTAMYAAFLYGDDWVLLVGCWRQQVVYSATKLISVFNNAKDVMPQVNGYQTTDTKTVCGTGVLTGSVDPSMQNIAANYTGYAGGAIISFESYASYRNFNTPILFTWNS